MSADRQRLKSAIQLIAKEDPQIRGLLGEGQNKGGKASSASVGVSDAERDRICCDGSTSGSANPGTEEREVGDSQSGLDPNDPADIGGGDGTLSGVTDCATGESICFDGSGFIPPDGWDEPDDPPISPEYDPSESLYWADYNEATSRPHARTKGQIKDVLRGRTVSGRTFSYFSTDEDDVVRACYDGLCNRWIQVSEYKCGGTTDYASTPVGSLYCGTQYGWPTDDEMHVDAWPSDGCTNLIVKDGKIVGSKFDPENDGSYSAPRDSIDLCSNGDQISLAPAANGGWKTINSTTDNGYLYNSKNERIAHIDGNEYSDPSV